MKNRSVSIRLYRAVGVACAVAALLGLASCHKEPTAHAPAGGAQEAEPFFTGLGKIHIPLTTQSEDAQKYFDQGLALSFAFNHRPADRSFVEATVRDPNCALCYWGSALVIGPNVNDYPMHPGNVARARVLAAQANRLAANGSPKEQALAAALVERYGPEGSNYDPTALNVAYADAMRAVAALFPDDANVLALAAESQMDLHPWDFWFVDGTSQPWTPEIVATIEKALAVDPENIGAIHLYIHAVEQSQDANRAAKYADRLADLAPMAGHLVHMPAHIYIRVGRYHDSTLNNMKAIESDKNFLAACSSSSKDDYRLGYAPHNWHFGWITAAIEGWSAKAIELAKGTAQVPSESMRAPGLAAMRQHFYMQPSFAYLRFGRWDDVLAIPEPDQDLIYARALWHYAAGEAELGKGHVEAARAHLDTLKMLSADPVLNDELLFTNNKAVDVLAVAQAFLSADVLRRSGDLNGAIDGFETALDREIALKYDEPPDWFYPVRHALGEAELAAGDAVNAERTYRADLETYPENGWSLFGLAAALRAQGKNDEANAVDTRFKSAWAHADVQLTATRL